MNTAPPSRPYPRRRPAVTLTGKFILLLIGFLSLQLIQLAIGMLAALHLGEEAGAIDIAGRQRLHTLSLLTTARDALASGDAIAWQRLDTEIDAYHRFFVEFDPQRRSAGERLFFVGVHGHLSAPLRVARRAWEDDLAPLLTELALKAPTEAEAALARYAALAPEQIARFDALVTELDKAIREDTLRLAGLQATIVAGSVLLGLIGLWMARRIVSRPMARLIEATAAIADGAYERRVAVRSHDEIGELARTFNRMAAAVGDHTARIVALNDAALALTAAHDLPGLLDEAMTSGMSLGSAQAAAVAWYDPGAQRLARWLHRGVSQEFGAALDAALGAAADAAIAQGRYQFCNGGTPCMLDAQARREGLRCAILLPLVAYRGPLGVLVYFRRDQDRYMPAEAELLVTFARLVAGAAETAQLHAQTQEMAVTDALTGLRNRRLFGERLGEELLRAQRYAKPLSLMMLDLDLFKDINDRHGHVAGDAVLQQFGRLLAAQMRDVDLAARYGGEEFAVILPETDGDAARRIGERIRAAVQAAHFEAPDGQVIPLTVSIGIAAAPPAPKDGAVLIEAADAALYQAKQAGRNCVRG